MRLFVTMTQNVELFEPVRGNEVKLYVCGVTPYDTAHLGHAFTFASFDILIRLMRSKGWKVTFVENVTDIDDPLFAKAEQLGNISWEELAQQETDRFVREMQSIQVTMPDHFVRASEELPAMFDLIAKLLQNGNAYINDGWIYFSVKSDPNYAALASAAGLNGYENLLNTANENGNNGGDARKRDPLDFLLWRGRSEGDPAEWDSPWGKGRPGWHIECSAMATKYLGPQIDIHGGGSDLIFPHHSSEIAQTENATGQRPYVRFWMHIGMVALDGQKMSKSLGNLVIVGKLLERYTPNAVRVELARHHYREPWEFFYDEMDDSQRIAHAIDRAVNGRPPINHLKYTDKTPVYRQQFMDALEEDLNTPEAVALLQMFTEELLRGDLSEDDAIAAQRAIRETSALLGLK